MPGAQRLIDLGAIPQSQNVMVNDNQVFGGNLRENRIITESAK